MRISKFLLHVLFKLTTLVGVGNTFSSSLRYQRLAFSADHVNLGRVSKDGHDLMETAYLDLFDESVIPMDSSNFSVPVELAVDLSSSPETRQLNKDIWNTRYAFKVKLKKGQEHKQNGQCTRSIDVFARNGARGSLSVIWKNDPPIVAAPSVIGFGKVLPGSNSSKRVLFLHSLEGKKFKVISAVCDPGAPFVTADFDSHHSDQHQIQFILRLPGDVRSHVLSGRIQIKTDEESLPLIEVHWSATTDPSTDDKPRAFRG